MASDFDKYLKMIVEKNTNNHFTTPKIYIPKTIKNGKQIADINQYWYIYFYFRNEQTGKKELFKKYLGINKQKTIESRRKLANEFIKIITDSLNAGFSPNNDKSNPFENKFKTSLIIPATISEDSSFIKALIDALEQKRKSLKENTYKGYKWRVEAFITWLVDNDKKTIQVSEFNFDEALSYITYLSSTDISATSIDNTRRELSAVFNVMKKNRVIPENYFASIETKKSKPKRHKSFNKKQVKELKKHIKDNDLNLYYFITIMMYCFLRNREAVNLKVGDIDISKKILSTETKTEKVSYKILTDNVIDILVNVYQIQDKPKDHFIFTNKAGVTGYWDAKENTKLRVFSDAFKDVKNVFNLSEDYTIYGFRHTIIIDVYSNLLKSGFNEREAISKLMGITGHTSELALRKYLRDMGAILPDSSVNYTTIDF